MTSTPGTEVAVPVETPDERRAFYRIAEQLAHKIHDTEFVPRVYRRRPMAVLAAVLYGHELGLEPITSVNVIDVIDGRPSLNAEAQRALVLAAGHTFDIVELTVERCTVQGVRADAAGVNLRVTWTMEDAARAKLTHKDNWEKYPRAMLLARATSELCGAIFPDVVGGFASSVVDVTGVDPTDDVEVDVRTGELAPRCALDDVETVEEIHDGPAPDVPASETVDGPGEVIPTDEDAGTLPFVEIVEFADVVEDAAEEYADDDPERPF